MTVYVDDMKAQYGRMKMCHMLADTEEELTKWLTRLGCEERGSKQEVGRTTMSLKVKEN